MSSRAVRVDPTIVIEELRNSRKYAHLCDQALLRTARWAAGGSATARDAVKKAKRKLHQVYGAYVTAWEPRYLDALPALTGEGPTPDITDLKGHCLRAMALHSSARERLPYLDRFYREIFEVAGIPRTVLDLGCGLHPLGIPWMGLGAGSRYDALDMDGRVVDAVGSFLALIGQDGSATCGDLLDVSTGYAFLGASQPADRYDLAFLLKTVPCLEHEEEGASERLLRHAPARRVVVSFACESLGGGRRQGVRHYDAVGERILRDLGWSGVRLLIGNELILVTGPDPAGNRTF